MNVTGTDVVGVIGDSIADKDYPYQIFRPVLNNIRNVLAPDTNPPATWPPAVSSFAVPSWPPASIGAHVPASWPPAVAAQPAVPLSWNEAVAGYTTQALALNIAAYIAKYPLTTIWLIHVGINDVLTSVPPANSVSSLGVVLDAIQATGAVALVDGPLCAGEKYPTGQNAFDTGIDALDAAFAAKVATYPGFAYVSLRTAVYAVEEPLLNTAANGFSDPNGDFLGPLTKPNSNAVHPIGTQVGGGTYFCAQAIDAQIVIV
jgi:hypothetical protein